MSDLDRPQVPPDDPPEDALARYIAGESAPDEAVRVEAWLAGHPAEAALVSLLAAREAAAGARAEAVVVDTEAALARVRGRLEVPALTVVRGGASAHPLQVRRRWGGPRVWGAAAAALMVLAVGVATQRDRRGPSGPRALRTAIGTRDSLRLPDGTLAILAPGSALEVLDGYGRGAREVRLDGAAFFEVVHDAARPFAVRTGEVVIRDLGTAFSVNTAADGRVAVAVTHGVVAVRPASGAEVELRAGDRGTADAQAVSVRRGVVTAEDVAWTRGVLHYRDTPLAEVRADLQRWYGLDLRIADDVLEARTLTASFRGERADDVIRLIALALGAEAVTQGDTVFLRPLRAADEAGPPPPP
jgi:transmembrane sensor